MKKSFIYNCLPLLFAAMATFSFTACGGGDGDDTDYAAIAAMQGALGGGTGGSMLDSRIVDLGLSVKWASCNVGATQPWEYGGYYAWGETEEKSEYTDRSYIHYDDKVNYITHLGTNIAGTQYDVATVKWGGTWRMPTEIELIELVNKCTWTWTAINGVSGYRVTGPNGNSIFLPAAGFNGFHGTGTGWGLSGQGSYARYRTSSSYTTYSTFATSLRFSEGNIDYDDKLSTIPDGHTVRPVCP